MYRLARHDIGRRFARPGTRAAVQVAFGAACSAIMLAIMQLVQLGMPLTAPFAFLFPAVVIATLYGHWPAGLTALVTGVAAIWHFVLPDAVPLSFAGTSASARATTATVTGIVLLLFAEMFRRNVALHAAEREREITRRDMLLRELEHRTRNNFSLVASLLEFQRRQSDSAEVRQALDDAISRVYTFADAYSQLASAETEGSEVEMKPYLSRLLGRFTDALFPGHVAVESEIAGLALPSQKAVAIGLYLNEALTNCAKYAFPEGRGGRVTVALGRENGGWRLTVADDGIGEAAPAPAPPPRTGGGLGAILFEALAAQAGAKHHVSLPGQGRRLDLVGLD